jgi:alpha-glucosidase
MPQLNQSLGNAHSVETTHHGVSLRTNKALVELTVYSAGIVRVRVTRDGDHDSPSYAVVAAPQEARFDVRVSARRVELRTESLVVQIGRRPLRIRLLSTDGSVVNADDPAFGTSWIGTQVTTYKSLQSGERFLGLGEKTGNLDRRGEAYTNWNTDAFAYATDRDPIYASLPFYLGLHSGLVYGVLLDNTHRTNFNFGASNDRFSSFSADDGVMDYYLFHGPGIRDILHGYTWLTGRMPLPPMWSLGYHQCRYSYYPETAVQTLADGFRQRRIPADVIHFDIHHMDAYKVFTWDKQRFPRPKAMVGELQRKGFRSVVILDPGIKTEPGYRPYEQGLKRDLFVNYPDGTPYRGQVWPGWCHFPDFTDPRVRQWWADALRAYLDVGVEGYWNDMNEPAAWGQCPPNLIEFDYDGHRTTHLQARNIYGLQMARSSFDGARIRGRRPFILTRAAFCGIQRYAAVWTGDNISSDDHMLAGVRLVNSLGLTGVPFSGYDIGGFAGEPSPALYARWISIGALAPFSRSHTMINSRAAEPWAFGEEVEAIARNYLQLRYRLLPYLYSVFHESSQTGLPVARSLAIDHPHDSCVYDARFQNQYLLGDALLVAPVSSDHDLAKVYLPPGVWYDLYQDERFEGGQVITVDAPVERLPVFVRAGSVIPMQSPILHTGEATDGVLQLHVYAGGRGQSTYYEDDGVSYDYETGDFLTREISMDRRALHLSKTAGAYRSAFGRLRLLIHGTARARSVTVNDRRRELVATTVRLCDPLASFDPLDPEDRDPYGEARVASLELAHTRSAIKIQW